MYLTQTELANRWVAWNAPLTKGQILEEVIDDDLSSSEKIEMTDGVNYYEGKNTFINERKREYYLDKKRFEDFTKPNNKVAHGFLKILIDQTVAYLVGNKPTINFNDNVFADRSDYIVNDKFYDMLTEWVKGGCEKGVEWLHPHVDANGEFNYVITDARQIIPIYDTKFKNSLVGVIRYYPVYVYNNEGGREERYKAEWWDDVQVEFYEQDQNGHFVPDREEQINPRYHFLKENTAVENSLEAVSWGRVPFVKLNNNPEQIPDLRWIKSMIDDYDLNVSDFSNALAEIAEFIYVLRGYEGTNLNEFVKNLKEKHAIKVDTEGGVDALKPEISKDARDTHLDRLEENIYIFGQGVNPNTDKFGNAPSGIALKFMYLLLDLKSGIKERQTEKAIKEFMWFVAEYYKIKESLTFDSNNIDVTFNKRMIINELEQIGACQQSKGIVSDETILEHHPFVDDVQDELAKLKEQTPVFNLDEDEDESDKIKDNDNGDDSE